jgi:hypothetical protein
MLSSMVYRKNPSFIILSPTTIKVDQVLGSKTPKYSAVLRLNSSECHSLVIAVSLIGFGGKLVISGPIYSFELSKSLFKPFVKKPFMFADFDETVRRCHF